MGLFVADVLAADPEAESLSQLPQHAVGQRLNRPSRTGRHDGLGEAGLTGLLDEPGHPGPQRQLPRRHQRGVMGLFELHQGIKAGLEWSHALRLRQERRQALPSAADRQQPQIGVGIPTPGQVVGGEGPVEGPAVALKLSLSQGAIHIPKQGAEATGHGMTSKALP